MLVAAKGIGVRLWWRPEGADSSLEGESCLMVAGSNLVKVGEAKKMAGKSTARVVARLDRTIMG